MNTTKITMLRKNKVLDFRIREQEMISRIRFLFSSLQYDKLTNNNSVQQQTTVILLETKAKVIRVMVNLFAPFDYYLGNWE
jgi:hypothetical protein